MLCIAGTSAATLAQFAGDPADRTVLPTQFAVTRLAPGAWAGTASFHVDVASGSRLWFRIRASSPLNQTWIQLPTQPIIRITPDNVTTYGGTYMTFEGGAPGPFILPTNDPGFQYLYDFPSVGPGQYTVYLWAKTGITNEIAVITELMSDSPVAVNLIAVTPEVAVGDTAVLTAAVFDGAAAVLGAKVDVTIISPSGAVNPLSPLTLVDEGELPKGDHLARDGLYSNIFTPSETGEYTVHAAITGFRSNGVFFERDAGTSVRVVGRCATLTGFLADYGQDDNDNGRYESLVIEAEATVNASSTFVLQAILETATGKTLTAYGQDDTGSPGTRLLKARVSSDAIQAAGEPGPYRVVAVELTCLGESGAIPAGRILPNTATHPYRLEQFEPPPPPDCNSNGIGDTVEIAYQLAQDCNHSGFPDECDITAGTSQDADQNGIPDECSIIVSPAPDLSGINKSRFISFSVPIAATAAVGETALRVKLTSLHHVVPPYTAGASIPFTAFEGQSMWVGPPVQYVESVSSGTSFMASKLQCTPYYQDWSTISLLHVTGEAIVPSSSYDVENLAFACQGQETSAPCLSGGANVSTPLAMATGRWGDVVATFQLPTPPATQPDFNDIGALADKFKSAVGAPIKARAMLAGYGLRGLINITPDLGFGHISACVDGFKGMAYPYKVGKCTGAQTTACITDVDCGANGPCILCP
jgi:hypothetical protein